MIFKCFGFFYYFLRLTEDITVFASSIAHLYSSITKPCFDLMLIGLTLMSSTMRLQGLKTNILFGKYNYYLSLSNYQLISI